MLTDSIPRGDLKRALGPEAGEYLAQIDGAIEGSPERFAVVKIGGEMAQGDYLEQLSGSVAHLGRLGYLPVLVHGGGPQIDRLFEEREIPKADRIGGDRITSPEAMDAVEDALLGVSSEIKNGLASQNVQAAVIARPFDAELKDPAKLGMVGTPVSIDTDKIAGIVAEGKVPIIACLGEVMVSGRLASANINGDDAAARLVEQLNPEKFMTLTKPGGVKDSSGRMIPNLTQHSAEELLDEGVIEGGMAKKVGAILKLIGSGVRDDGVLTHPNHIIRELFTHEGAGTLISGDIAISQFNNMNGLDESRIRELIEDAFGGHLNEDYFNKLELDEHSIYITPQRYDGIGITRQAGDLNALYLDKLAVTPGEQGRGIADEILERIAADTKDSGGFFWRAAPEAVFMQKYESFAEDRQHVEGPDGREWSVFCHNMHGWQIPNAVAWAASRPITIERHPDDAPF